MRGHSNPTDSILLSRATQARILFWLFAATTLVYLFLAGSNISSGDTYAELHVADSLVTRAAFDVPVQTPGQTCAGWGCQGIDGKFYATHGIGNSLWLVPFLFIARGAQSLFNAPNCNTWVRCVPIHLVCWNTTILTSATVTLLAWLGLRLGYGLYASLSMSLIYGFASLAWPYARYGFDVTLTALLLLASYAFLLGRSDRRTPARNRELPGLSAVLGAGVCAGLAVLVRLPSLAAMLPLAILLALDARGFSHFGRRARLLLAFAAPVACALAFTAWYNAVRFGSMLDDGHRANTADQFSSTPWAGIFGIVISPGKGLLWYCPVILLCVALSPRFYRFQRRASVIAWSVAILSLVPYVLVNDWYGGDAWGPRFVLPVLPLMFMPLLELPGALRAPGLRAIGIGVIAVSIFVQAAGQFVNYADRLHLASHAVALHETLWSPDHSPLLDHARTFLTYISHPGAAATPVPRSQSFDVWWLNLWRIDGSPRALSMGAGSIFAVLAVLAGMKLVAEIQRASA